jgi:hypothetical protein
LKLNAGDVTGAVQALADSAASLDRSGKRKLQAAPRMLLAQKLLQVGQIGPVLAYLEECSRFEYPGGEARTDEGNNPFSPAGLAAAIRAGIEPQFAPGTLEIY